MAVDVDISAELSELALVRPAAHRRPNNIILVGASAAGKSTTGQLLARLLGYGFFDLDTLVERRAGKTTAAIFASAGEDAFRRYESEAIRAMAGMRSHVLATGGGAVMDDANWEALQALGTTVWVNVPEGEIARRLLTNEAELAQRPLLADVLNHKDLETRMKLLSERIRALVGNRAERYRQAHISVADQFSTPESTAHLIRSALVQASVFSLPTGQKPYDRWQIL